MTTTSTLAEELGAFVAEFDLMRAPERDVLLERAAWQILDAIGSAYVGWATEDGHAAKLRRIELNECGHPVPDERGVEGARRIAASLWMRVQVRRTPDGSAAREPRRQAP